MGNTEIHMGLYASVSASKASGPILQHIHWPNSLGSPESIIKSLQFDAKHRRPLRGSWVSQQYWSESLLPPSGPVANTGGQTTGAGTCSQGTRLFKWRRSCKQLLKSGNNSLNFLKIKNEITKCNCTAVMTKVHHPVVMESKVKADHDKLSSYQSNTISFELTHISILPFNQSKSGIVKEKPVKLLWLPVCGNDTTPRHTIYTQKRVWLEIWQFLNTELIKLADLSQV